MADRPRVAVVVPSWNGREHLDQVLESLAEQRYRDFETIVVDNGSTDGSVAHLAEAWPDVRVVALDDNRGFAAAVNVGIESSTAEFVALVNNDVELEPGWLEIAVDALDRHPGAGSVASKLLEWSRRNVLDGAGDLVGWDGYCVRRGKGERDRGQYDGSPRVLSACAAAALYRRRALDDVGSFDESFFAYIEDVDWGLRAQLAGWDCIYEPTAVAYHVGGASSSRLSGFELFQCHRNIVSMMVKDFPASVLLASVPWAFARRLGSLVKAAMRGEARLLLGAWSAAAGELPGALRARRAIQRRRRRRSREVLRLMRRPAYLGVGWKSRS
jgi:GT2 family glycosyltransferase